MDDVITVQLVPKSVDKYEEMVYLRRGGMLWTCIHVDFLTDKVNIDDLQDGKSIPIDIVQVKEGE